jgi:hypothetical protein
MIIGIIVLLVVVGAAIAYFANRPTETPVAVAVPGDTDHTTIVNNPAPVSPRAGAPSTVIVNPPATHSTTTTHTERNTTVVVPPATSGDAAASGDAGAASGDSGAASGGSNP